MDCFAGAIKNINVFEMWEHHECTAACLKTNPDFKEMKAVMKERKFPFLAMPLVFCWQRLMSTDPCKVSSKVVKCNLPINWFSFSENVNETNYFVPEFGIIAIPVNNHNAINDISAGYEYLPISVINCVDKVVDPESLLKTYITSYTFSEAISKADDSDFLTCCDCVDDCKDKTKCSCSQLTLQNLDPQLREKYDSEGTDVGYTYKHLFTHFLSGIYECNSKCQCSNRTCVNRIVQEERFVQLQLFRTHDKGWGVRTMHDIPKGSFICNYVGNIITVQKVSKFSRDMKDAWKYLANLRVAHQLKDGYEHTAILPDDEINWKEDDCYKSIKSEDGCPTGRRNRPSFKNGYRASKNLFTTPIPSHDFQRTPSNPNHTENKVLLKSGLSKTCSRKTIVQSPVEEQTCCFVGTPIKNKSHVKKNFEEMATRSSTVNQSFYHTKPLKHVEFKITKRKQRNDNFKNYKAKGVYFINRKSRARNGVNKGKITIKPHLHNIMSQKLRGIRKNPYSNYLGTAIQNCALNGVPVKVRHCWAKRLLRNSKYNLRPKLSTPRKIRRKRFKGKHSKNNKERKIGKYVIDGRNEGNIGRFLNHSCDPNVFSQYVFTESHDINLPNLSFFALKDIPAGTELTWDYKYEIQHNAREVIFCRCGAKNCRGRLC